MAPRPRRLKWFEAWCIAPCQQSLGQGAPAQAGDDDLFNELLETSGTAIAVVIRALRRLGYVREARIAFEPVKMYALVFEDQC
jgi:hypothetical protein